MRTIGIIGGLSWEATALYYRLLNEAAAKALGEHHNARSVIVSVDFAEPLALANAGDWDGLAALLTAAARQVCAGGAEVVLLGANTAHIVAEQVAGAIDVPLLHIADTAGEAAQAQGYRYVGLLGTKFTLESPIYAQRLRDRFGLMVSIPQAAARNELQRIIIDELTLGRIEAMSRGRCLEMIRHMQSAGVEAVVVACTELPMLLQQDESPLPLLDTTALHVEAAVRWALA